MLNRGDIPFLALGSFLGAITMGWAMARWDVFGWVAVITGTIGLVSWAIGREKGKRANGSHAKRS